VTTAVEHTICNAQASNMIQQITITWTSRILHGNAMNVNIFVND